MAKILTDNMLYWGQEVMKVFRTYIFNVGYLVEALLVMLDGPRLPLESFFSWALN